MQNKKLTAYVISPTLIAVGSEGTIIRSVDIGQNWAQIGGSLTNKQLNGVASNGAGGWVAVGESGTVLCSTNTGKGFAKAASGTTKNLMAVTYDPKHKHWYAVGTSGTIIKSPNGKDWSAVNSGTTKMLFDIKHNGLKGNDSLLAAVGQSRSAFYCKDGNTWKVSSVGVNLNIYGLAPDPSGKFVAVGHRTAISGSGAGWVPVPDSDDPYNPLIVLNDVASNGKPNNLMWLAVGNKGKMGRMAQETHGKFRQTNDTLTNKRLTGIVYAKDRWFIVGEERTILISNPDMFNWKTPTAINIQPTRNLNDIAYNGAK